MSSFKEYDTYDGLGLADLAKKGDATPLELVDAAIQRIEERNPALNAVIIKLYEDARKRAKAMAPAAKGKSPAEGANAPFWGVPFLIKDLLSSMEGVPTGAGNRLLKDIPEKQDSEMVRRWRAAGLIILGKTNTPEFGLTPFTESKTFGPARNPWDTTRTPGGSSGGSAAAVAARMVPLASGGDGGGSIRIPASACGLFGLKPSRGRMPTGPKIGESWRGFVQEHVLTRSVRDSAALLDATAGMDVGAPYACPAQDRPFLDEVSTTPGKLRIALTGAPMMGKAVDGEVLRCLERTAAVLKDLGHEVIQAAPTIDREAFSLAFVTILAAELRADIEDAARRAGKKVSVRDYDPASFGLGMLGKALSAETYASAARYLQKSGREVSRFFVDYDVLLTPVLSKPPVPIGSLLPSLGERALIRVIGSFDGGGLLKKMGIIKPLAAQTFEFMPWTPVFNVTGQPAMSVPLETTGEGLPCGMHFVGRFGDEATLFRLAGQLEQAKPWIGRLPPGT
jgi:amidase